MTTVKCPICNEEVTGGSAEALTANLRSHLADVHGKTELLGMSGMKAPVGPATSTEKEKLLRRNVEQFVGPTGANRLEGKPGEDQYVGPQSKEQLEGCDLQEKFVGPSDVCRAEEAKMLNCPICGAQLQADTEDGLTMQLSEHMAATHDVRSAIKEPMSR